MARIVYTRQRRYSYRKRGVISYPALAGIILALAIAIFLMVCGCIFVWNTFFREDVSQTGGIPAVNGSQLTGELQETQEPDSDLAAVGTEETTETQETQETQEPDDECVVVLDAGHGGKDGGANSGEVVEKDITLSVTKKMKKLLEDLDITVVMTRETDVFLSLEERTQISNEERADLFVSIHCNSYEADANVKGIECYYAEDDEISKQVAKTIMSDLKGLKGTRNRGIKEEDHFVTKYNDAPAVLVEMGFLTNPTECKQLTDSDHQQLLAQELVDGIVRWLESSAMKEKQTLPR